MKKADGFESQQMFVVPPNMTGALSEHPLLRQLYVTDIGFFPKALHHYRERPAGSDTHIFVYCSGGEGLVRIGANSYRIRERTLALVPANTPHVYQADDADPWSIYWFHLYGEQASAFAQSLGLEASPIRLGVNESAKLIELFRQIFDLLADNMYAVEHWVHAAQTARYMLSYLGVTRNRPKDGKSQGYIDGAVEYMRERLEANLTLEELAFRCRISKQHLHHLFKQSTGYPPIDYYLRLKMQRAVQLLDLTDRSIKEVGLSLGFRDPYYFSRMFKRIIGLSPSAYRNQAKG